MRTRWLLNLLLLLVALAGALLYLGREPRDTPEDPARLSHMNPDAVSAIRIEHADGTVIALARRQGDWRLTAPIATDAADDRVESILQLPGSVSQSRFDAADRELEAFGLAPPQLTLTFNDQVFVIGDPGALDDGQRYVLHDGRVHLISDRLYPRLAAPFTYYVPTRLIPADRSVRAIHLPGGVLRRAGDGWLAVPQTLAAEPQRAAETWTRAQAVYVKRHEATDAAYQGQVRIEFTAGEPLHYRILTPESQTVLVNPELDLAYHLDQNLAHQLLLAPAVAGDNADP